VVPIVGFSWVVVLFGVVWFCREFCALCFVPAPSVSLPVLPFFLPVLSLCCRLDIPFAGVSFEQLRQPLSVVVGSALLSCFFGKGWFWLGFAWLLLTLPPLRTNNRM
jgi:hypothetical protein